jgi:hypothetical protein
MYFHGCDTCILYNLENKIFPTEYKIWTVNQNYICNKGPYIMKTEFDKQDWVDTGLRIPTEDESLDCISMETREDGLYLRYQNYDTKEFKYLLIAQ